MVRIVNEAGEQHRFERLPSGEIVSETTFDGQKREYRLNHDGEITRVHDALRGNVMLTYDAVGRLVERNFDNGVVDKFEWDELDRIRCARSGTSEVRFEYGDDGSQRERHIIDGVEYWVATTNDRGGSRVSRRSSLGYTEAIQRDAMTAPVGIELGGTEQMTVLWDAAGRETQRRLPGGGIISSVFDATSQLARRSVQQVGRAPASPMEPPEWIGPIPPGATWDKVYQKSRGGRLATTWELGRGVTQFDHDADGRISGRFPQSGDDEQFAYDAAWNVFETGPGAAQRSYAAGGRVQRHGRNELIHDANGRLVQKNTTLDDGTIESFGYEWNKRNDLVSVTAPDGTRTEYTYDAFRRRVGKRTVPPEGATGGSSTVFVWDGETLLHEICRRADERGDPVVEQRTYAFIDNRIDPVAQQVELRDASGVHASHWQYYVTGQVMQPEVLVSGGGEILGRFELSAYGKLLDAEGPATTPFRLPGQYADAESGLHYNRHRYYDPDLGLYISPDPIGLEGSFRPYGYAADCPTEAIDPEGLTWAVVKDKNGRKYYGQSGKDGLRHHSRNTGQGGKLHPAVANALAPDLDGVTPRGEYNPRNPTPSQCAEPRALSNYLYQYESTHEMEPGSLARPENKGKLADALSQIDTIGASRLKSGKERKAACPNCSQLIPRLFHQAGVTPPDDMIQKGQRRGKESRTTDPPKSYLDAVAAHNARNPSNKIAVYHQNSDGSFRGTYP